MAAFLLYTKPECPHCVRAKAALDERGIAYRVIDLDTEVKRAAVKAKTGYQTWPQIFALTDGRPTRFVGGADALIQELSAQ
jgi:glutaredoxin